MVLMLDRLVLMISMLRLWLLLLLWWVLGVGGVLCWLVVVEVMWGFWLV